MKAVILAGGLGMRLRPLTEKIPKTMVKISGKPILWYHIKNLKKHGINDIWMAHYYLPEVIQNYFGDGSKYDVKIYHSIAKVDLGTAGTLRNPNSNIEKELRKGRFLVVYGDNLTDFNFSKLIAFHIKNKSFCTIGLYKAEEPWTMGVIETDKDGLVKKFVEKPPKEEVITNTVSAGVMMCEPEILDYMPDGFSDFGFDIIPKLYKLKKKLMALDTNSYVQDIGTFERLKKARDGYKKGLVKI